MHANKFKLLIKIAPILSATYTFQELIYYKLVHFVYGE